MKILKGRLYELEKQKQKEKLDDLESSKKGDRVGQSNSLLCFSSIQND